MKWFLYGTESSAFMEEFLPEGNYHYADDRKPNQRGMPQLLTLVKNLGLEFIFLKSLLHRQTACLWILWTRASRATTVGGIFGARGYSEVSWHETGLSEHMTHCLKKNTENKF